MDKPTLYSILLWAALLIMSIGVPIWLMLTNWYERPIPPLSPPA